jgi:hypothetical protein
MKHEKFLPAIREVEISSYRKTALFAPLEISRADGIVVEYAPFDHIEKGAELVIVGLTPGRTQAANAIESLASSLRKGIAVVSALEIAKRTASFSGAMRNNLLAILDEIKLPQLFGRTSASEFFDEHNALAHFTSTLRYPVYLENGSNYSGTPDPLRHPELRRMIETYLAEEATALPNAVWIPVGTHAEAALLHLVKLGKIDRNRIVVGLPHPSGANAERIAYFLGRKDKSKLSAKTNALKIDEAKSKILAQVATLSAR